jgi:hypothetical protein
LSDTPEISEDPVRDVVARPRRKARAEMRRRPKNFARYALDRTLILLDNVHEHLPCRFTTLVRRFHCSRSGIVVPASFIGHTAPLKE